MSGSSTAGPLAVTGIGMVTPVGADAMGSALAIQAGISRLAALDEFPPQAYWDRGGEELQATGAAARDMTSGLIGVNRLVTLATPALMEAMGQAQINVDGTGITLLQAIPSAKRPQRDDRIEELFSRRLERRCGLAMGQLNCRFVDEGHAGIVAALRLAADLLTQDRTQQVVIGGVDSLVEPATLHWLEEMGRLKAGKRVDGFCPGEAAGYLVVEPAEQAKRQGKTILAFLSGFALATEPNTIWSKRPSVGKGLVEAIRQTIGPLREKGGGIRVVIGDLNGERYRALEWSYAEIRAFAGFDVERKVWHPADCIGDTGSASGAVSLIYGIASMLAGLPDSEMMLVFSSADDGQRGSVLVLNQAPASFAA